jgi:very-short-patch-repair endonuclease
MTCEALAPAPWWAVPPAQQVSYLVGADPELLRMALDPLPVNAPAVVQFRPTAGGPLGDQVTVLLDELDRAATALFPSWLPGAERLDASPGLGVAAVRALAARSAARSRNFGPFLADLAERGLLGRGDPRRFPPQVRAAGLTRVIAEAYGRRSAALLIDVPDGLAPADERVLGASAEWLAHHGRLTVWLAGAPLHVVDRLRTVAVTLPAYLAWLATDAPPTVDDAPGPTRGEPTGQAAPTFSYPPLSGLPRTDSPAELALERALAPHEWAFGRRWNHTYEWHILGRPYRLDLFWAAESLVVEVDGPDHRGRLKFADDRRRDVQLQLLGHDVLRFTNDQVLSDVHATVRKIQQSLSQRRAGAARSTEMRQHADHRLRTDAEAHSARRAGHPHG